MRMEFITIYGKWALAALALVVAITIGAILLSGDARELISGDVPTLPVQDGTGGGTTPPPPAGMTVAGKLGPVATLDFINNGITGADPQNPGTYYLAGSACVPQATYPGCPSGASTTSFDIKYDAGPQFFTVTLLAEPLGAARDEAERFMLNALGTTGDKLCTLYYYVGTTEDINPQFTGKNLGFSSCPGATALPD